MKVTFDPRAIEDLTNIHSWISLDRPATASAVIESILTSLERLGRFPEMGRAGVVEGTREWVIPRLPFIVVYAIDPRQDAVRVVGVFHGAKRRDELR
jgi:toxin ParE1/3/4